MERKHDEKKVRGQTPQLDKITNPHKKRKSILLDLQNKAGNQAVQRLIAQQKSEEGFDLDDKTTAEIQQARSGGQSLDRSLQRQMETKFGKSLDNVKLHTDQPANTLSQQLGASAFTVGSDVFFRDGKYDPSSSKGQELLAHELTHVIQQREGKVKSSKPGLNVRPAGDEFEQEADSTAQSLVSEAGPQPAEAPSVQRQEDWEDEIEDTSNYAGIGQALSAPTAAPSQPSHQVEAAQEEAATQAPPSSHSQQETAQIEDRPAETKPQQTQQVDAAQEAAIQTPSSSQSQQETAQIEDHSGDGKPLQQVETGNPYGTMIPSASSSQQETAQIEDRPLETKPQQEQQAEAAQEAATNQSNANPSLTPSQTKVRVEAATQETVQEPSTSHTQQEVAQSEGQAKSSRISQSQVAPAHDPTRQVETGYPDVVRVPTASHAQQETAQVEDYSEAPKKKTIKEEELQMQSQEEYEELPEEEELQMQSEEEEEEWEELQMQSEEEEEEEEAIQPQIEEEEEEELQLQQEPEEEEEEYVEEEKKQPEEEEEPYEAFPTQDPSTMQTDEQLRREMELRRRSYY